MAEHLLGKKGVASSILAPGSVIGEAGKGKIVGPIPTLGSLERLDEYSNLAVLVPLEMNISATWL